MTITEMGSFHVTDAKETMCPKCGFESVEGHGVGIQIGEDMIVFCPKCFVKFIAEHVPQMTICAPEKPD